MEADEGQGSSNSALDPANFNTVLLIQVSRLYDVMMAFLATVNPQKAQELYDLHESGQYLTAPPALALASDDEES